MVSQAQYGKNRSKEALQLHNRIGTAEGYKKTRQRREVMKEYTLKRSGDNEVPIPGSFSIPGWIFAAIDNKDWDDDSSLSGTEGKHQSVTALYQEITYNPPPKSSLSEMGITKTVKSLKDVLPCQVVNPHEKPILRPKIPSDMPLAEQYTSLSILDEAKQVGIDTETIEFAISIVRCGIPLSGYKPGTIPPWGAIHALTTKANPPVMRVGFAPIVQKPITDRATVRQLMVNLQSIRRQVQQDELAFASDEAVFCIVVDILLCEPTLFSDLFAVMGLFHLVKVLLRCAGRFLTGSGMDTSLIESCVFGPKTLLTVLSSTHYVRAFSGMQIVSEVVQRWMFDAFLEENKDNEELESFQGIVQDLRDALSESSRDRSQLSFWTTVRF